MNLPMMWVNTNVAAHFSLEEPPIGGAVCSYFMVLAYNNLGTPRSVHVWEPSSLGSAEILGRLPPPIGSSFYFFPL